MTTASACAASASFDRPVSRSTLPRWKRYLASSRRNSGWLGYSARCSPLEGDGVAVGRLRFLKPVGGLEYPAKIAVAHRQGPADIASGGEVGGKLFSNRQGLGVGILRFLRPPGLVE